ncbi:MAG: hypothetical protein IH589_11260 [Anaerolineales bacterium]|nr:hypothetical protein [Anaerolineales bacterium]
MNKQLKKLMLVVITVLLLAACGPFEPAPELPVIENPAETPEPVVIAEPTQDIPTAVLSDGSAPEKFSKYIGLSYPPFPAGLTEGFSMMIQGTEDHGLWLVMDGADKMLWLSEITHYDANGTAFWEVRDVLVLSNVEAGLILIPDGCSLNDVPNSEIISAGRNGVIVLAWRANTSLDKFEVIPPDGIKCNSDKGVSLD